MSAVPPAAATLEALRRRRPLVHCVTNHVTSGLVANALLALGAVPAMVEGLDEVAEFCSRADALAVNLGTLTPARAEAMRCAAAAAREHGVPWVLDPVAAGGLATRASLARELLEHRPAVIRGNASEIPALLDNFVHRTSGGSGRGPEADAAVSAALPGAHALAQQSGGIVALTGAVDWVIGGGRSLSVHGGHPLMARVSGAGCAATAIVAACLAVQPDPVAASVHGLAFLGQAGAIAAERAGGPGSFVPLLLDALTELQPAQFDAPNIGASGWHLSAGGG